MQSVLFTPVFERHAREAGLTEDELMVIAKTLSENPLAGDMIKGTGGTRKLRFGKRGKGKSGGYRTIHYFGGEDVPVFALALVDKGNRADLNQAERNELARILAEIARAYREGVTESIIQMRSRT